MGPRSGERGEVALGGVLVAFDLASMGPRSGERGEAPDNLRKTTRP